MQNQRNRFKVILWRTGNVHSMLRNWIELQINYNPKRPQYSQGNILNREVQLRYRRLRRK